MLYAVFAVLLGIQSELPAQTFISTYAGTDWLFNANGKSAASAPLGRIVDISVDPRGRPVFVDQDNQMVMRVNDDGLISVLAGNGIVAFSGDGGLAQNASLNTPSALTIDAQGNIYICDSFNHRIRRVSPQGIITTFAGTGVQGIGADGILATSSQLNSPSAIAVDSTGRVCFVVRSADNSVKRIRCVNTSGQIRTFAGNGGQKYSHIENAPATTVALGDVSSLTFDAANNLYLTETTEGVIRRITPGGMIQLVGSRAGVTGIATNQSGLWITAGNQILRMNNGQFTVIAGTESAGYQDGSLASAQFNSPVNIALDAGGGIYVADRENLRLRKILPNSVTTTAGNGAFQQYSDGTPAGLAFFHSPYGVNLGLLGGIFVADTNNARLRKVEDDKTQTVAGNGVRGPGKVGVQATQTGNLGPKSAVTDAEGNIYYSDGGYAAARDGHVIRRIDKNGVVTIFAGTGILGLGAENVPATSTPMADPRQIFLDDKGDLYIAESFANRIRVISRGTIRTLAGARDGSDGKPSAENIPSLSAKLFNPEGVAVDKSGNVYISDTGNGAIRIVDRNGNLSTIAGAGKLILQAGQSAPAKEVQLVSPSQIGLDPTNGTLLIADNVTNIVYRYTSGTLIALAGTGQDGFAGDGRAPSEALLSQPGGVAADSDGNVYIADTGNNRIRIIQRVPPTFGISEAQLTFKAKSGGAAPTPLPVQIEGSVSGMQFQTQVNVEASSWLSLSVAEGVVPGIIQIAADPSQLQSGHYDGTVTFTVAGANPAQRRLSVSLDIAPPDPPILGLDPVEVTFNVGVGTAAVTQDVVVQNLGGSQLTFTYSKSSGPAPAPWLTVNSNNLAALPNSPGMLTLTANPANIDPGTYSTSILVQPNVGEAKQVPVTLTVNETRPRILLSPVALRFLAIKGQVSASEQPITLRNGGKGTLRYRVTAEYLSGNDWLSLRNNEGSIEAAADSASVVGISIDTAKLEVGYYHALLRITDPTDQATNSPHNVSVYLSIQEPGSALVPELTPSAVVFESAPGSQPGSQTVKMENQTGADLQYQTTRDLPASQDWITAIPSNGVIPSGQSVNLVIQPNLSRASAGLNRGTLTVRFSDSSIRTIDVVSFVPESSQPKTEPTGKGVSRSATGCIVQISPISPQNSFVETGLRPIPLKLSVVPTCKTSSITAQVEFDNGDRIERLQQGQGNEWVGTWTPQHKDASRIKLVFRVFAVFTTSAIAGDEVPIFGRFQAPAPQALPQPAIPIQTGLLDPATTDRSSTVAPGSKITLLGRDLAGDPLSAGNQNNLPLQLGGTRLELAGKPLPLLRVSESEIEAIIPFGLKVNDLQSLIVVRDSVPGVPGDLPVARAKPGILTSDGSGRGQANIFRLSPDGTLTLADANNPVHQGDDVVIHCTGLGEVDSPLPAGTLPPSGVAARVVTTPTVQIGGKSIIPASVTLSAEVIGRYEIRLTVPQGIESGDAVPVIVASSGQSSQVVTMAVR